MSDRLRQIRAAQVGRHSKDGPQAGQEVVALAAFLIARADIDYLLGVIDSAALIVGPAMDYWRKWEAQERYVSAETVMAQMQARDALWAACAGRAKAEDWFQRHNALEEQVDQLRVQLAGCLTAAEGHIAEPVTRSNYGWSLAYERVVELRQSRDAALADVDSALTENDALLLQVAGLEDQFKRSQAQLGVAIQALQPGDLPGQGLRRALSGGGRDREDGRHGANDPAVRAARPPVGRRGDLRGVSETGGSMKGFIEVYDRDAGTRLIAVDTIADVVEVRGYGNYGRLIRKDGSRVDCSESYPSLVGKIGAAMQDDEATARRVRGEEG